MICERVAPVISFLIGKCTYLNLSLNKLSDKLIKAMLIEIDELPCAVKELNLQYCGLTENGLAMLHQALHIYFVNLEVFTCEIVNE